MGYTKTELQAAIQLAQENLIDFAMLTNPHYDPQWFHEEIAKKLMAVERGEIKRLMLTLPPRHGKSALASIIFPAWFLGRNPRKEVITSSYGEQLAVDFGTKARSLVDSPEYQQIFSTKLRKDAKSKTKWNVTFKDKGIQRNGGSYTSVGAGGTITGRGADIFIIDDPIKGGEEASSELIRDKVESWYYSDVYTRLEKDAAIIIIQTRWHMDDLVGRLLEHDTDEWEIINFPALAEEDDEFRKKGDALWSDKYSKEYLEGYREKDVYHFACLFQQRPIIAENQEFRKEYFLPRNPEDISHHNTRNYLTIDTAVSKKKTADYTGLCINQIDEDNCWNLTAWKERISPQDLIQKLFILYDSYRFEKIGIEETMYFQTLKPFLEEEMRKRGIFLPVVPVKHNFRSKEDRIRGLLPRYAAKGIYHIDARELEMELMEFPYGKHDDVADAASYQNQVVDQTTRQKVAHQFTPEL